MNEKELKALQEAIELKQNEQTKLINDLKTSHVAQIDTIVKKLDKSEADLKLLSDSYNALELKMKDQKLDGRPENPFAEMKKIMTDPAELAKLKKGGQRTFEVKATMDEETYLGAGTTNLSTSVVLPFREFGVSKAPDRRTTLLDLVSRAPINANRISWVERTARTNNLDTAAHASVVQGATYLASDYTYNQKFSQVEKIGQYVKVTAEALEDWDQLYATIQDELFTAVERAIELEIYSGTGTSPQLKGITTVCTAYTLTTEITGVVTPNIFDAARAALAQLAIANFYGPFTVVVNPADGAKMDMPKNADGQYLLPPFIGLDRRIISGAKVVESNLVTAGYMLVGDFNKDKLFMRRGVEIKIWDQEASDAIFDLKTITASVRCVNRLTIPDYSAFVYDAIDDIVTAIS
jgi:HK97 family phage major capsid protein